MTFTPVNEIERLLVSATRDPSTRPAFYRALTEHELVIISDAQRPTEEDLARTGGKSEIQIQLLDVQGTPHVPIFTSKERIAPLVQGETRYLVMNGRALFTMLRGSELVMNPGSEYGKVFVKSEVEAILDGSILQLGPTQNLGGQKVLLSQPKEYPRQLTDALSMCFLPHPQVRAAYLAQAHFGGLDQSPHTMIGIDMAGDWKPLIGEAGLVARSVARPGEVIDFMQMTGKPDDAVSAHLRSTKPFYQRDDLKPHGA